MDCIERHECTALCSEKLRITHCASHLSDCTGLVHDMGCCHQPSWLDDRNQCPLVSRCHLAAPVKGSKRKACLQAKITDSFPAKKSRQYDRFKGMTEEEVLQRGLPDYLKHGLDIVFVGINPGLAAACAGRYYTGPGNHFWKCLHLSGIVEREMSAEDDYQLLKYGIGFTNMVARTTKGSADLSKEELKEGRRILADKVRKFQPKILVFNGKISYEVFCGKKTFDFGIQAGRVQGAPTRIWVMPSSSARCAQLPRASDKVPFYEALRRYRDFLNGVLNCVSEDEFRFTDVRLVGFKKIKETGAA